MRAVRPAHLVVSLVLALVAGPFAFTGGAATAETTPLVIDSFDSASTGVGFGIRSIATSGGVTNQFSGGAANLTLPYAQNAAATLTYTSSTPVDLTAGGADRLRFAFDSITTDDTSGSAVIAYLTATDNTGKTRYATSTGVGPTAAAGAVVWAYGQQSTNFQGPGDLTKMTQLVLTVQPASNAGDHLSTIALSTFATVNPAGVPGPSTTPQTITFPQPTTPASIGSSAALGASASSLLTVTYGVTTPTVCHLSGSTVLYDHAGTCHITADQAGNATYDAAPRVSRDVTVSKTSQTVSFTSTKPDPAAINDTYAATATSSSAGLTVSFAAGASSPADACTVTSTGAVLFKHAGTCVVAASQSGDSDRAAAASVTQSIIVAKSAQTVTFTSTKPDPAAIGGSYAATATSSAGLTVSFAAGASSPAGACTVTSTGAVLFKHAGTCVVAASQSGDSDRAAAASVTQSITVAKSAQTVSFTSTKPDPAAIGGSYAATATSSAGLTVSFAAGASSPADACTVTSTGAVSFQHAGTCVVTASQDGDADRNPATTVSQSIAVGKSAQSVTFTSTAPAPAAINGTYQAAASASSGLTVTYVVGANSPATACTVSATGSVTFNHAGTCVVTASQGGDDNHEPATTVSQSITVAKTAQTVGFTSTKPDPAAIGDAYAAVAAASSGLPVTYAVGAGSPSDACTVSSTGSVSFQHAGTCVVTAGQSGSADVSAAPVVSQTITIAKSVQAITFTSTPPAPAYVGATYDVVAIGGGGTAPVTYSSTTPATCSVSAATVTLLAAGQCGVRADQAGDADHSAATPSVQSVTVTKVPSTVSIATDPAQPVYGQKVTATAQVAPATGTTAGTVQFSVDGTPVGAGGPGQRWQGHQRRPGPTGRRRRTLSAAFTPSNATTYASADGTLSVAVAKAATTAVVKVEPAALVATVAPVAPGAGTPSGAVEFRVDGTVVGTAVLVDGAARLGYTVPAGAARAVAATYAGDVRFTASSDSTTRVDPTITASISAHPGISKAGWYRGKVTVSFTCSAPGGALVAPCPAPVVLHRNGAGQSVSRTVTTTDGGVATTVANGINIDTTAPKVSLKGPRAGAHYVGTVPTAPRCKAADALSGIDSCRVKKFSRQVAGGTRLRYVAVATDRAGNRARSAVSVTVATIGVVGVPVRNGVFQTRVGHGYTVVVLGSAPRYRYAAPAPGAPHGGDVPFKRAGSVGGVKRWTIGIAITPAMRHHKLWNLGVVQNGHLRIVRIRVR